MYGNDLDKNKCAHLAQLGDSLGSFSEEALKTQGISFTEAWCWLRQLLQITVNCLNNQSLVVITTV